LAFIIADQINAPLNVAVRPHDVDTVRVFRNVVEVDGEAWVKETKTDASTRVVLIPPEPVALLGIQCKRVLETAHGARNNSATRYICFLVLPVR
jgi:hypothetical protein